MGRGEREGDWPGKYRLRYALPEEPGADMRKCPLRHAAEPAAGAAVHCFIGEDDQKEDDATDDSRMFWVNIDARGHRQKGFEKELLDSYALATTLYIIDPRRWLEALW